MVDVKGHFGGKSKSPFKPPHPLSKMGIEEYKYYSKQTSKISVLELASCGGNMAVGGLAENPHIPEDLQLRLILPSNAKAIGVSKWTVISELYGGDYGEYMYATFKKLCVNPNISKTALRYIIEEAPSFRAIDCF